MSETNKNKSVNKGNTKKRPANNTANKNNGAVKKKVVKKKVIKKKVVKQKNKKTFKENLREAFNIKDAWQVFRLVHYFVIAITIGIGILLMAKVHDMGVLPVRYFVLVAVVLLLIPVVSILLRKKANMIA